MAAMHGYNLDPPPTTAEDVVPLLDTLADVTTQDGPLRDTVRRLLIVRGERAVVRPINTEHYDNEDVEEKSGDEEHDSRESRSNDLESASEPGHKQVQDGIEDALSTDGRIAVQLPLIQALKRTLYIFFWVTLLALLRFPALSLTPEATAPEEEDADIIGVLAIPPSISNASTSSRDESNDLVSVHERFIIGGKKSDES